MRIDPSEFRARTLRVHSLLQDVPIEDVWAISLRGGGTGRTIHDLRPIFRAWVEAAPRVIKGCSACAGEGYLAYWAIYVQPVTRFTRRYMTAIAPFRRLVVYPAIIRKVQRAWAERYAGATD